MNNVILIGRLTKTPEVNKTTNGKSYCQFTLAVNRTYKNADGTYGTDFINCITWGATADNLARYQAKGSQLAVEGSIEVGSYTNKDGTNIRTTTVNVSKVHFLAKVEAPKEVKEKTPKDFDNTPNETFGDDILPF